ncbi:hypothetical protein [Lysinibacillus sp. 54212]|uniref:hypothetical protein n=1 Tax=Lysinibacillus sp. 54212 TaxID=3119829 RepID=UPI002FCA7C19
MTYDIFNDKFLQYLFTSDMFQHLSQVEQQAFLQYFANDEQFIRIMNVALAFQEEIAEVETMVPILFEGSEIPAINTSEVRKATLKDQVVIEDNVCFVPFQTEVDLAAPLIIALDCSESMQTLEDLAKGLIIPCFNLCAQQKRDCIVLPFSETTKQPIVFTHGKLHIQNMNELIHLKMCNRANLLPVFKQALALFDMYNAKQDAELMLVTTNYFDDYVDSNTSSYIRQLKNHNVELSLIALNEQQFNEEPLDFIDKVFFCS